MTMTDNLEPLGSQNMGGWASRFDGQGKPTAKEIIIVWATI